ncbi:hypothetical protein MN608_06582 [Microdochium nivale]|nr:hypothetical protein MN608_06582 [Microdochium nivale]
MHFKSLAIAALAASAQAQTPGGGSLQIPIVSDLVNDLLGQLGNVGVALGTATGLLTGAGNNPLGLAGSLPGILSSLGAVTGLLEGLNNILPLFGDADGDITEGQELQLCTAVGAVKAKQISLTDAAEKLKKKKGLLGIPLLDGLVGGVVGGLVNLIVSLVTGLLGGTTTPDTPGLPDLGIKCNISLGGGVKV